MKRLSEWALYLGVALVVAPIVVPIAWPLFSGPDWARMRWSVAAAGAALLVLSLWLEVGDLRTFFARRTARYGVNSAVMILLVLAIIGLVEAVSYRHNTRLDLTENRRHSLSPQTIQLLKSLPTEVNAVGFFRSDQPGKRVAEDLFKQYARYANGRFTWKVVDPDREPALARRYGVESYGTTVLETSKRSEKVLDAEEEKLTNGLVKITREGKRVVYVLQGHGEHDVTDSERQGFSEAKSAMEKSNYEVKPLVLARETKVADDAAVVIIPGARNELFPPELDALDAYLGRGGKILVMVDSPFAQRVSGDGLKRLLGKWGFDIGDNVVIEVSPIGQLFGIREPLVPVVIQYESHPITRDLRGTATIWPITRSVAPVKTPPSGVSVQSLIKTSPQSWGETDRDAFQRGVVQKDTKDVPGPVSIAAVATKDTARLVVYGTSNLPANQFLNLQSNRDFFLNTVSWLAEQEDLIAIRPKETKQTPIFLNSQQAWSVFLIPVVIVPAIVAIGGGVAFLRRRSGA